MSIATKQVLPTSTITIFFGMKDYFIGMCIYVVVESTETCIYSCMVMNIQFSIFN